MAQVNIEEIIDYLSSDLRQALEQAVKRVIPDAEFNRNVLFREFIKSVRRRCNIWEQVPDIYIRE